MCFWGSFQLWQVDVKVLNSSILRSSNRGGVKTIRPHTPKSPRMVPSKNKFRSAMPEVASGLRSQIRVPSWECGGLADHRWSASPPLHSNCRLWDLEVHLERRTPKCAVIHQYFHCQCCLWPFLIGSQWSASPPVRHTPQILGFGSN